VPLPLDVSKPKQTNKFDKVNPLELRKIATSVYTLEDL
jgi:hypothetical protein